VSIAHVPLIFTSHDKNKIFLFKLGKLGRARKGAGKKRTLVSNLIKINSFLGCRKGPTFEYISRQKNN
jgi:hypothetical protein